MDWITSGGGPLICLSRSIIRSWMGVDGLGDPKYHEKGFRSDYERACGIKDYVGVIPVLASTGIVLGDMPLDTTVLRSPDGLPLIARVFYSEPLMDIESMVLAEFNSEDAKEVESIEICIREVDWLVFDSAYPGVEGLKNCLPFAIPVGDFCIKTFEYKPDSSTFLLINKFNYSNI